MKFISMKTDCVLAAAVAATLTAAAVVAWGNYKFSQMEAAIRELGNQPPVAESNIETIKSGVKEGLVEFLREASAKSGANGKPSAAGDALVKAPEVTQADYILGRPDAPVTMMVYTDVECPYCRRFHETTVPTLRAKYPTDLRVVYRHLPLPFHGPAAVKEAVMAECVGKTRGSDAFYAFMDAAFASSGGNGKGFGAVLPPAVEALIGDAKACIDHMDTLPLVEASARGAEELGITGTPTIFLMRTGADQAFIFKGAAPAEQLTPRIEQLRGVTKG